MTMRPPGPGDAHHLARRIVRARREHRAEHGEDEVEARIGQIGEVGGVALLEAEVRQAGGPGAVVAGGDEIRGDVDAGHSGAGTGGGKRGGAVAAAEIEHVHARADTEFGDQLLTAVAHGLRDPREIAFFPEGLVGVHP